MKTLYVMEADVIPHERAEDKTTRVFATLTPPNPCNCRANEVLAGQQR